MEYRLLSGAGLEEYAGLSCFLVSRDAGALYDAGWQERISGLTRVVQAAANGAGGEAGENGDASPASRCWLDARTVAYGGTWKKHLAPNEAVKTAVADFLKLAESEKAQEVRFVLDGAAGSESGMFEAVVRAVGIGAWRFRKYREKKNEALDRLIVGFVVVDGRRAELEEVMERALSLAASVNIARELINEPGNVLYPAVLADRAAGVAAEAGIECEILDREALAAGGYAGILAVGQGSRYEPRMVVMRYRPVGGGNGKHVAIVGKGITFDTGGISLKPGKDMHEMKSDMSGAAAVIGAMRTVGLARPDFAVTGIIVSAENNIGPEAQRPGDIFRHKSGKHVQVDNTDAEGRLCLIDGLCRAGEEGASVIVDLATLTGACLRALGQSVAGVMGNDEGLIGALQAAGQRSGEAIWPFPLIEEYGPELETPHADLRNIGSGYAGMIVAALFMRHFVPEKCLWAHLDIAGPAYFEKGWKYYAPGATGFGTQLVADWLLDGAPTRKA